MRVLETIEEATPDWLTEALQQIGVLDTGRVETVTTRLNEAFNSIVAHLELAYSGDAPTNAPEGLILKLNRDEDGQQEVSLYQLVAEEAGFLPMLAKCYSAVYHAETGRSHCLFEDVSQGWGQLTREQLITLQSLIPNQFLHQIVQALAEFHAYWWEHPRLGSEAAITQARWWYRDKAHYERHIQRRTKEFNQFVQSCGDQIPASWLELYNKALGNLPLLWERYLEPRLTTFRNLTITNGDFYLTQCLYCLDPAGQAILIDFQDGAANFGTFDLVFLLASFLTREQRQFKQREKILLRLYHSTLLEKGVRNYSWEALQEDYRLMLSILIFVVVWDQTAGANKTYWWPKMTCILAAYEDWDCASLVQSHA